MSMASHCEDAPNTSLELAPSALLLQGHPYAKKPALSGFRVYYTDDAHHVAYNPLEDTEYSGAGIYMIGLLGEIWKIGSFEKLVTSYVLDEVGAELEITEDSLRDTKPANGTDCSSCLAVRYRAGATPPILAARVPLTTASIVHIADDGTHYTLHANKPCNSRGAVVAHGEGDMIACPLVLTKATTDDESVLYRIADTVYKPKVSSAYIINGEIFERTYAEIADYRVL